MSTYSRAQKQEYYRNGGGGGRQTNTSERYYCKVCNVWMGSDKVSILTHNNGKKHQDNVIRVTEKKRKEEIDNEKYRDEIQRTKQRVEQAAYEQFVQKDYTNFAMINENPLNIIQQTQQQYHTAPETTYSVEPISSWKYTDNNNSNEATIKPTSIGSTTGQGIVSFSIQKQQINKTKPTSHNSTINSTTIKTEDEKPRMMHVSNDCFTNNVIDTQPPLILSSYDDNDSNINGHYDIEVIKMELNDSNDNNKGTRVETLTKKTKVGVVTYLDGTIYGESILRPDMPIQLWVGTNTNSTISIPEQRLPYNQHLWIDAIVIQIRKNNSNIVADVAYLKRKKNKIMKHERINSSSSSKSNNTNTTGTFQTIEKEELNNNANDDNEDDDDEDEEEVIEKSVPLNRIRIQLNSKHDERIPQTLEQARILLLGGEEIITINPPSDQQHEIQPDQDDQQQKLPKVENGNENDKDNKDDDDVDYNLTSWSTVEIKRTTAILTSKQEQEQERRNQVNFNSSRYKKRREEEQRKKQKEIDIRQMEEAKTLGYNDSALGAYDVWNRGTKEGYKGIRIHDELKIEPAASTMIGMSSLDDKMKQAGSIKVEFKKLSAKSASSGNFKKSIKQNRRRTSADDD